MKVSIARTVETALAAAGLLVVWVMSTNVPIEYPSWPEIGDYPVNPELVVPGVLAIVVLANAIRDGYGIRSDGVATAVRSGDAISTIGIGLLGALTLFLATTSLYTLYADTGGCLFVGGLLTLTAGVPLALLVLGRRVVGGIAGWYRRRNAADEA